MTRGLLFLLGLFVALPSFSQVRTSKLKPLYFQASKNKLQVLPQRFEYTLLDEDRLKIGDILLDTTQVSFQLEQSKDNQGTYRIRFTWPAELIKEGELAIKNNSGKAIFNTLISKSNVTLSQGKLREEDEGLRSQIGTLVVDNVPANLIEDMKYLPFMVFCIYRETEETRLYLCSNELYLSSQDGAIKSRTSTKKPAQIEINGKVVGNQGIIYLNDRKESVAFKAQTQTGAFLEIETRMKEVDFKDVVVSNNNTELILTAAGAEPVKEETVKKISEKEWQVSLPMSRPVLYLKGDGDIPMRQEFYVRGPLPQEKNRAYLSNRSAWRTYSSQLSFFGVTPEGVDPKIAGADSKSTIKKLKKNQFLWTLQDIPRGKESRHYLTLSTQDQDFIAGYDVFRGHPYRLGLTAHYLTPSQIAFGTIDFQWWLEKFLFMDSSWAHFHWGFALEREQHLTESDETATVDMTTLALLWRAQEGFQLVDETWGLSLPLQMVESSGASTLTYGLGAFIEKRPGRWLKYFMHWSELRLHYFLGSSGSDFKISSAYSLDAIGYWQFSSQWFLRYGLTLSDYKYDPSAPKEDVQFGIKTGVFWKF